MASKAKSKRSRVNMRLPAELLAWAKGYASVENTSLTQIVIDHLTKLRKKHDETTISR